MQKRLEEIKRRWGDNSGLGFLKGATIDAERVCVCVCMCECVCMHEPPVRLCTMDVCVELRRSGGSRPDCSNPEVVVAITGRVLHNAPGCSKSCGEDGGVRGPCEPSKPHQELQRHGMKAEYAAITQNSCLILLNWLCSSVRGAFKHIFLDWRAQRSLQCMLTVYYRLFEPAFIPGVRYCSVCYQNSIYSQSQIHFGLDLTSLCCVSFAIKKF